MFWRWAHPCNTGFIGTAILTLLLGSHWAVYLSLTLIIENLSHRDAYADSGRKGAVSKCARCERPAYAQPLTAPVSAGDTLFQPAETLSAEPRNFSDHHRSELLVLLQLKLPTALAQVLEMLGKTASPLALFVIGGSLVGMKLQHQSAKRRAGLL